jgi:hypothetical protein
LTASKRKINTNLLLIAVLFVFIMINQKVCSQTYFSTVEIRYNLPKKWQIRLRPTVFTFPNDGFRTELMLGKTLNANWKIFSYTQIDFYRTKYQSGVRIDYTKTFFNNKLLAQGQIRTFVGLSKDTKFEGIFVGDLHYRFFPKFAFGLRNFTLESPDEERFIKVRRSFVGPAAWFYSSPKSSFLTYYGPNLMTKNSFLFMFVWFVTI